MSVHNKKPAEEISALIRDMRDGSEVAATQLWRYYWDRLLRVSKRKLAGFGSRMADEEDVAITAFHSFIKRMRRGDYSQVENRDEAWKLLVVITVRKAINLVRDAKRQRRNPQLVPDDRAVELAFEDHVDKDAVTPDTHLMISDSVEHLLGVLNSDELREIAMAKVAGFTNQEIAKSLGRSIATIERRLNLIRAIWEREL